MAKPTDPPPRELDLYEQLLAPEPVETLFEQIQITAPELWRTLGDIAVKAYPGSKDREAAILFAWEGSMHWPDHLLNPLAERILAQRLGDAEPFSQTVDTLLAETVLGQAIEAVITAIKRRQLRWDAIDPQFHKRVTPAEELLRRLVGNGWHRVRHQIPTERGALADVRFYDPPPPASPNPRQPDLALETPPPAEVVSAALATTQAAQTLAAAGEVRPPPVRVAPPPEDPVDAFLVAAHVEGYRLRGPADSDKRITGNQLEEMAVQAQAARSRMALVTRAAKLKPEPGKPPGLLGLDLPSERAPRRAKNKQATSKDEQKTS